MKQLVRYEILIIGAPEITPDEERSIEKQISDLVIKAEGTVLSFERWGKYKLYYPIRKNEYGVYYLMRFQSLPLVTLLNDIRSLFMIRFDVPVMRHLITALEPEASLEYQRPRSLEEAPAQEVFGNKERSFDKKGVSDADFAHDDEIVVQEL